MKWAIFLILALAVSGCATEHYSGEITISETGQQSGTIRTNDYVYTGQLKEGWPHGRGKITYPSIGMGYNGTFRNGVPHGAGRCTLLALGKSYPCRCNNGTCPFEAALTERDVARLRATTQP